MEAEQEVLEAAPVLDNRLLTDVTNHIFNAVIITDADSRICWVNRAFERITGWHAAEAIGRKMSILKSGEMPESLYRDLWQTILQGRTWRGVMKNRRKDGTTYVAKNVITPIRDEGGHVKGFFAIQEDITERIAAEDALRERSERDAATGLFNRVAFMERLELLLREARPSEVVAILIVELDDLSAINAMYGVGTGNRVLVQVAASLNRWKELSDKRFVVGYLGGDEFGVAGPVSSGAEAWEAANGLIQAVAESRFHEVATWPTASIGFALFPIDGTGVEALLTRADVALRVARDRGGGRAHRYKSEDHVSVVSRLSELEAVRAALREGRFFPVYQPLLHLSTLSIRHFEALARMRRPDGSTAMPSDFIETAERFNTVGEIDRAIMRCVMEDVARAMKEGRDVTVSVNLSGQDLSDEALPEYIRALTHETGVQPSHIVFEITETAAVRDFSKARRMVQNLKADGYRFALDDFGVGFASFSYLKELPVDYVKIDGSFIRRLDENDFDRVVVEAIVKVVRYSGVGTVAEFVETISTLRLLRTLGVDMAQGYAVGRPGPSLEEAVPETLLEALGEEGVH